MSIRDINFFIEDVDFKIKDIQKLREWIGRTAKNEGFKRIGELSFVYCSDEYLYKINMQYLDHDTYTDIITFDNSEVQGMLSGDIYISVDRVLDNSKTLGTSVKDELHRVIIHGVLHLLGYFDKTDEQQALMTQKEDFYLNQRGF